MGTVETVIMYIDLNTQHPILELYNTAEANNYEIPVNTLQANQCVKLIYTMNVRLNSVPP